MPTYEYRCLPSGKVYEVKHAMSAKARTWAELCDLGGLERGDTPPDAPVERLISAAGVVSRRALRNPEAPPCGASNPCCGGSCGIPG
jgi:predicted nucleic acid-binding Zn ribbon protein